MPFYESFSVSSERIGRVHRLTTVGELDIATVSVLEREFDAANGGDADAIVVDLSQLTFMDSSGVHLLIRMDCACLGSRRLRLITGPAAIDRLLEITGVRAHLPIVEPDQHIDAR